MSWGGGLRRVRVSRIGKAAGFGAKPVEGVRPRERALTEHEYVRWNQIAASGTLPEPWRPTELRWIPKPGVVGDHPRDQRGARLMPQISAWSWLVIIPI